MVKRCRFRWDSYERVWWTDQPEAAQKLTRLLGNANGSLDSLVKAINEDQRREQAVQQANIEASRAISSNFNVPLSEACRKLGYAFFPCQRAGIEFAILHPRVLIGDQMGVGKTPQAIGVINVDTSINNALLIVPKNIKRNWERQLNLWLSRPLPVHRMVNGGEFPQGGIVILNYEQVKKYRPQIDAIKWDMLCCDEVHALKNNQAQRTQYVLGKWHANPEKLITPIRARRMVFLTGTPLVNRPIELWTLCHALDPDGLGRSYAYFTRHFCNAQSGRYGFDRSGAANLDELQARLRQFMIRRLKSEVLTELPAKRRQLIVLDADSPEARAAIAGERQQAERMAEVERLMAEVERLSTDEASAAYKDAAAQLQQARRVVFQETSLVRHQTALAKVPQVIEHCKDVLTSEQKLVVFAWHHDEIDQLAAGLREDGTTVVTSDGRDSEKVRDAAWQSFQNDPDLRVFIGSIPTCGVGIDLFAASVAVFCSIDWVPGAISQAEDRLHRHGQKNAVLVQHLVLDGSLDARMTEMLIAKQEVISAAVDEEARLPEVQPVEVIKVEPRPVIDPEPIFDPEAEVTRDEREAIHLGLKILAGVCDYANQRDDVGFNGSDAVFGHSLAEAPFLSRKQAVWGRKLLMKYHRQLGPELMARIKGNH